ncbi:hypothetical protein [Nonomuraea angiospora]|uniref:hypothetical protein n=1 Tax=Nonomuraea angiospora TaxID=46172 RepID=UPI0029B8F036|nr:hypothetical protein [Nonomuraea angiospora]MDX3099718.1 hypothetical protein [Nonomuraea angiospora]
MKANTDTTDESAFTDVETTGVPPIVSNTAIRMTAALARLLPADRQERYIAEFHVELFDLAQAKATRAMQILYALQEMRQIMRLRAALRTPDQPRFHWLQRLAYWTLSSDIRTWGVLGPPIALAVVNIFRVQGWGSALFTIPGIVAFYGGVEWLRKHWGVTVTRRKTRSNEARQDERYRS